MAPPWSLVWRPNKLAGRISSARPPACSRIPGKDCSHELGSALCVASYRCRTHALDLAEVSAWRLPKLQHYGATRYYPCITDACADGRGLLSYSAGFLHGLDVAPVGSGEETGCGSQPTSLHQSVQAVALPARLA